MKQVTMPVFQTSNGRLFFDEQEARDVETKLAFEAFVDKHWDVDRYDASKDEVVEWLIKHASKLKQLLSEPK